MSVQGTGQRAPRVGINAVFLGERAGGVGRYTRNLLRALTELEDGPSLTVFAGSRLPADLSEQPWARAVEWIRLPVAPANPLSVAAQLAAIPLLARARRLDLIHSPGNSGPLRAPVPTVLTLHDLIWLHHPAEWEHRRRARASTRALSLRAARASTRVLTDSTASGDDILDTLGLPRERLDVVPLAAEPPSDRPAPEGPLRERLGLAGRPFVLSVAQKRRYKRLDTLVRALPHLDDRIALVLVGPSTPHEAELRELAAEAGVAERVRYVDWVADDELETLYAACRCFALPSIIEGFGLPVLEALQRGVPVACAGRGALPEVAGEAALYFDPEDQVQVTAALARLTGEEDLRARLSAAGRRRAERFSWRRTAELTLASYERALRSRRV